MQNSFLTCIKIATQMFAVNNILADQNQFNLCKQKSKGAKRNYSTLYYFKTVGGLQGKCNASTTVNMQFRRPAKLGSC